MEASPGRLRVLGRELTGRPGARALGETIDERLDRRLVGAVLDGALDQIGERWMGDETELLRDRASIDPRLIGEPSVADKAPTANSSESPGKNGVTTSPVSQKMMRKRIA